METWQTTKSCAAVGAITAVLLAVVAGCWREWAVFVAGLVFFVVWVSVLAYADMCQTRDRRGL